MEWQQGDRGDWIFDVYEGLYVYCMNNHTGKCSRAYRALSVMLMPPRNFRAGRDISAREDLTRAGQTFYDHLVRRGY